jgi:hypothetical protein
LLPKSSKHFIQPTAEKLNCDLSKVEDAVGFFYSELRKSLTNMAGPNVKVPNIGTFKVKPSELPKLKDKYEGHLSVLSPDTFTQMSTKKDLEIRLEKVNNLQKMLDDEKARKHEFLKKKNEYTKNNMEEPKADSGGSSE